MTTIDKQPVFFISHGGGPWPWMPEQRDTLYAHLAKSLSNLLDNLPQRPDTILMVSAHWEAPVFTVQTSQQPTMIYDYMGFPEHTYHIRYPSSGSSALAQRIVELLSQSNIPVSTNPSRGYDHGMYAPMQMINPAADIPVVQLSLKKGLDPEIHIEMGQALAPLRDENVLILASGLSYHNLRLFNASAAVPSQAFDTWLNDAVVKHSGESREQLLEQWETAPAARIAHPREEHLIPLMVAAGAAFDDVATRIYHENTFMGGLSVSSFAFGLE